MCELLSECFGYSADDVAEQMFLGVPILAEGTCLCVAVQHDEA